MAKKIVHVVGTGTIGEPLIGILATFRESFGLDEITFHKRTPLLTDRSKVMVLEQKGAKLCADKERWENFKEMGMEPHYEAEQAIERAAVSNNKDPTAATTIEDPSLVARVRMIPSPP
jgi:hypothetical protein